MKRIIFNLYVAAFAGAAFVFAACDGDDSGDISSQSIITSDVVEQTPLDKWLEVNYLQPYNIEIKYRYEYNETDGNYFTVPADYDQAVEMAHIVKYSCVEAYDEIAGIDFTRTYFPKMFYFEGEWHYMNNGNFELGTAEGGKKIFLMGINYLDQYKVNISTLNHYYLKTIHHEFTHILNQTVDYPASFQLITGTGYVADSWSDSPWNTGYLQRGFISAYAQQSDAEDFAEMMSIYVTNTAEQWEEWMDEAENGDGGSAEARQNIQSKLDIVKTYMRDNFDIDLDELRKIVLRRENDIVSGRVDLTDVSID